MNLIKGIHHISLKCCNQEEFKKVVDFYENILQMPVARSWAEGIMFDTGSGIIEIFANGQDSPNQGVIRHFAFATDDALSCIAKVREAGYKVIAEPKDVVINSEPPLPIRVAFCIGPLGEEIEFFEERQV